MSEINFTGIIKFKSNKPYRIKKAIITAFLVAIIVYAISYAGLVYAILSGVMLLFFGGGIKLLGEKGKGKFFSGIVRKYSEWMKKEIIDELPVRFNASEDSIKVSIINAERYLFQTVGETFIIAKTDLLQLSFYRPDHSFVIHASGARVNIEGTSLNKTSKSGKLILIFYLPNKEPFNLIIDELNKNGYQVEIFESFNAAKENDEEIRNS